MKITKEHVGKKVKTTRPSYYKWVEVLYIYPSEEKFAGRGDTGGEGNFDCDGCNAWQFYHEPKPEKLVAPALFYSDNEDKRWVLSDSCFEDLETAKKYFKPTYKVVWPAVPNAQGFYEVPE